MQSFGRRTFLKAATAGAAAAGLPTLARTAEAEPAAADRHNVIFLVQKLKEERP